MESIQDRDASEVEFFRRRIPAGLSVIVTCMDPRISMRKIYDALKIQEHQAFILRNAGGRAQEALRSIIVSQHLLHTKDIHIIQHYGCGMCDHSEESMQAAIMDSLRENPGDGNLLPIFAHIVNQHRFVPIRTKDIEESVLQDCALVRRYPLVRSGTTVRGWTYRFRDKPAEDEVSEVMSPTES